MTSSARSIILTIGLALLAGFGGVWVGAALLPRPSAEPNLHAIVHEELQLTPAQRQRIEAVEKTFATRRRALELEMRSANAELAAAIREEHGYGPRVMAAVERFHNAMGSLQTETIRHVFAMREVMTPEQQAKFDDIVATALTAESQ
jgi:Spy/CpxP family protein refolding chaperone